MSLKDMFKINYRQAVDKVVEFLREQTFLNLKRDGIIVGISGGVDSSLTVALSAEALGKERVMGLILPERESDPKSRPYAERMAKKIGIVYEVFDITNILESFGIYKRRDATIKKIFPDYTEKSKFKIYLPQNLTKGPMVNFFHIEAEISSDRRTERLSRETYLEIIAATQVKLRVRMTMLYYFAQCRNYLVAGTSNRTEIGLGNVCKYGDGGVDVETIAHLYKTQVFALARYMGVPKEIISREPSPDMFPMETTDEEWYFGLPFKQLDPLLYAYENNISKEKIAKFLNMNANAVGNVFINFKNKKKATQNTFSEIPRIK